MVPTAQWSEVGAIIREFTRKFPIEFLNSSGSRQEKFADLLGQITFQIREKNTCPEATYLIPR